ncbi:MAG: response regulator transcription factor [Akkermansiaceae bacterium]|nr:response regulator transcription factor [Verrucomicrobiales bacterium]
MESIGALSRDDTVNVWLVDDSENFRVLLAALLEDEGGIKCVRQFSSAEEVLAILAKEPGPAVILLDNRMPGMGGLAAIRPITELAPATHVLMLTTFGDTEVKARALRDGASDFLLKSFHVAEIAERIRRVQARPKRPALVSATTDSAWPDRRAAEMMGVGMGSEQTQLPELGRRNDVDQNSESLLRRGVNFLRAWAGQAGGRNIHGKAIERLVQIETPR